MWSDFLSVAEARFTESALAVLASVAWARPLLHRLAQAGGIKTANLPLLFEVRVAYELHRAGVTADYEFAAGVGNTTIDFRVYGSPEWLIETASVGESDAVKSATRRYGMLSEVTLTDVEPDSKSSEEGELILLEQKLGEKVFRSGRATKFPCPKGAMHLILADTRGFNVGLGDRYDYLHATEGVSVLRDEVYVRYWNGKPIKGLFESGNPLAAARLVQERVHFIGFVRERQFCDGEIPRECYLCPNGRLFGYSREATLAAYRSFPLRRPAP
jgi:hypothetical protein